MNFPLASLQTVSVENPWSYLVFILIGFAFGYVLEISGFGNSQKLAAQFYFRELTVLKVMFGAIVTAMVLLFLMIGLGALDYSQVYVNTTYLWPMIVGGLIMGVGFIIGGFCPGTSLVGMITGKLDALLFVVGVLSGIFLFGETERFYDVWWQTSGYLGRYTLMDLFGLPAGVVVTGVVAMALFMFWGAEQLEGIFGKRDLRREPPLRVAGAAALLAGGLVVIAVGVPTAEQKYARMAPVMDTALNLRAVQISPAELFHTLYDNKLQPILLDVRSEADYNLFHIREARQVAPDGVAGLVPGLLAETAANRVIIVMSNDEAVATAAWKTLMAESVPNVYILAGGVNGWLAVFGQEDAAIVPMSAGAPETLRYRFPAALGDRYAAAAPSLIEYEKLAYEAKIRLLLQRDKSGGGCG